MGVEFLTPNVKGEFVMKFLEITEEDRQQVLGELVEANEKLQKLEFARLPNMEGDKEIDYWQNFGQ
jgi:hypothetical protein